MSESEKDPQKPTKNQSRKKIKASTGAWWKSTVVNVDEAEPKDKEKISPAAKTPTSDQPSTPAQKKQKETATGKRPAAPRKKRGRPAARKKSDETAAEQKGEQPITEQASPDSDKEQPVTAEAAQKPDTPEDQATEDKPKRSRSPRGRRGGERNQPARKALNQPPNNQKRRQWKKKEQ